MSCGCDKISNSDVEACLTAMFPEFLTVTSDRINIFIDVAKLDVNCNAFRDRAKTALVYFTAYLITIADTDGDSPIGAISSEKVGDLARSYSSKASTSTGKHQENKYGRLYDNLKSTIFVGTVAVTNIRTSKSC